MTIFNRVLMKSLTWTVSLKQRHNGGKGMCHADILEETALSRGSSQRKDPGAEACHVC